MTNPLPLALSELRRRGRWAFPWRGTMYPAQLAILDDTAKRKVFLGAGRCGKTFVSNAGLLEAATKHPGGTALYLSLTGKQCRANLWPSLLEYNSRYTLGMTMPASVMTAECPNGSRIEISGADAENAVERLRGRPFSRVIIDEPGSFDPGRLAYLVQEVLGPRLRDYEGDLWFAGTPSAILAGEFYEACEGARAWAGHIYRATMRDNPYFAGRAERLLAEAMAEYGWTKDTPAYLREYEGVWARDTSAMVFDLDPARNFVDAPPPGLRHVISVDLGTSTTRETTAFVVTGYIVGGMAYPVYARKHAGLTPSDIGVELARLVAKHAPLAIVMDHGGLGGGYIKEIQQRFGLPVQPVQKQDKLGYVQLLAGDLRTGKVAIVRPECADLIAELNVLQWNEKRDGFDARFADHATDALIYGWRECRQYLRAPAVKLDTRTEEQIMMDREDHIASVPWWKRR
ncbi:MAG: hypothetical protein WC683_09425 [bacterium]